MLITLSATSSICFGAKKFASWLCLLWDSDPFGFLCLLCVSGPIILRRSLYRATANYDMGYPLYCENKLAPGDPVDFKISPFGGKSPHTRGWRGRGGCTASHPLGVKFFLLLSNYLDYQLLGMGWEGDWIPAGSSF